jgi:hypothetical protein
MLFSKEVFDGKRTKGKLSNIASRDADVRGYTNQPTHKEQKRMYRLIEVQLR